MELPLAGNGQDVGRSDGRQKKKEIFRYSLKKGRQLATILVGK